MDPSFLPYLRWMPVALLACIILAVAKFSSRPAVTLRRGGSLVLILALCMASLPYVPLNVFRFVPIVIIGLGTLSGFVRYYRSTPIQRQFGSLAQIMAAFKSGDYESALRLCDGPDLRKYPEVDAHFFRGSAFYHLRRLDEAGPCLLTAASKQPPPAKGALILDQLGLVYLEQGRRGDAVNNFQRSRELDPRRGGALRGEACVYLRGKYQLANALELAQGAVEKDRKQPSNLRASSLSTSLAALAWALAANARPAEARESVQKALGQSPRDSVPVAAEDHYMAGQAMLALGDRAAASQCFRKVVEMEPKGNFGFLARQELG